MNPSDIHESQKQVKAYFEDLLERHKDGVEALGWKSLESQQRRFRVLCDIADLGGASILDVGCGLGDLFAYLKTRFASFTYFGVDLSEKMVEAARKKYPEAAFEAADILTFEGRSYDYVIGTGFNAINTGCNADVIREAIRRMYDASTKGTAIQMLSDYSRSHDPASYYASPEEIFSYCMGFTRRCVLRHDYAPNDFTVFMYRE